MMTGISSGFKSLSIWLGLTCLALLAARLPYSYPDISQLLSHFQVQLPAKSSSNGNCRCLSTEPCWPSSEAFATLEAKLSQPLLAPQQLAKPCYTSLASDGCQAAQQQWENGWWRSNNPLSAGGTEHPNFATYVARDGHIEACYLNTTLGHPCMQGSIPTVGVDARSVEDIQTAINFAVAHNLRVVVKNTGHDYLGRSTARGAFLIWTHHLKDITYHDTFEPSGAPNGTVYRDAITLGSGVQWQEAYDAVFAKGRNIVGGIAPGASVGAAGGWLQGGGHSILSPQHGLGVDNALEMTVVTSDGKYHVVNAHQEPDLFWALRGGGGGTWGVVVSVTYQTHPSEPILTAFFMASPDTSTPGGAHAAGASFRALFTELVRVTPAMTDAGWAGYAILEPNVTTAQLGLRFAYVAPASATGAQGVMQDFFAAARRLTSGALNVQIASVAAMPSFGDWETKYVRGTSGQVGESMEVGSRLLPRDLLVRDPAAVADAVLGLQPAFTGFYLVAGGAVSKVDPDSASVNPAWRDALVHLFFAKGWAEGASLDAINAVRDQIKAGEAALHALTPGGGTYFNEASLYEPDFQRTFWGSHYDRLRAIKKQYDPVSLFVVPEGVGSEDWDADLNCRL